MFLELDAEPDSTNRRVGLVPRPARPARPARGSAAARAGGAGSSSVYVRHVPHGARASQGLAYAGDPFAAPPRDYALRERELAAPASPRRAYLTANAFPDCVTSVSAAALQAHSFRDLDESSCAYGPWNSRPLSAHREDQRVAREMALARRVALRELHEGPSIPHSHAPAARLGGVEALARAVAGESVR